MAMIDIVKSIKSATPINFELVLLVFLLFSSSDLSAEIYQWKDADGKVHFGDEKPENQEYTKKELKINDGIRFADEKDIAREKSRRKRKLAAKKRSDAHKATKEKKQKQLDRLIDKKVKERADIDRAERDAETLERAKWRSIKRQKENIRRARGH